MFLKEKETWRRGRREKKRWEKEEDGSRKNKVHMEVSYAYTSLY